jgi:hypothetical protein
MNNEIMVSLIALASGGGLTALVNGIVEHGKEKQTQRDKTIDDRIAAWQNISDRNELRIGQLERKLESYDRDFRSLERYVLALEQVIVLAGPPLKLPRRPHLEREEDEVRLSKGERLLSKEDLT